LLKNKADVNLKAPFNGNSALFFAVIGNALNKNREKIIKNLVIHGGDINLKNKLGQTPLILAVWNCPNKLNIIKKLVSLGADINIKDNKGWSALELATSDKVRKILLNTKIVPNNISTQKTPLSSKAK
jgi:ankyrin repeat protein